MKTETIYIDSLDHCHRIDDGAMTAVETDYFVGKCDVYVEGFCYEIRGNSPVIYAWKPYSELDSAQREYEKQLIADYESALAEIETALGVTV